MSAFPLPCPYIRSLRPSIPTEKVEFRHVGGERQHAFAVLPALVFKHHDPFVANVLHERVARGAREREILAVESDPGAAQKVGYRLRVAVADHVAHDKPHRQYEHYRENDIMSYFEFHSASYATVYSNVAE